MEIDPHRAADDAGSAAGLEAITQPSGGVDGAKWVPESRGMKDSLNTGLACVSAVARHHGIDLPADKLAHDYGVEPEQPVEPGLMARMTWNAGLKARVGKLSWSRVVAGGRSFPLLAQLINGNWIIIIGLSAQDGAEPDSLIVFDPLADQAGPIEVTREQLETRWGGRVVFVHRAYGIMDADQPYGFRWFLPQVMRERRLFRRGGSRGVGSAFAGICDASVFPDHGRQGARAPRPTPLCRCWPWASSSLSCSIRYSRFCVVIFCSTPPTGSTCAWVRARSVTCWDCPSASSSSARPVSS